MAATSPSSFTPAYRRIEAPSESLDGISCVAMVSGKPIADVFKVAVEKFKLRPTNGPYYIDQSRLQILLAAFGFVASNFKEITSMNDVPDLALVWQDTDPEMDMGKVFLFHRMKDFGNPKQSFAYVIDTTAQSDPSRCIRTEFADIGLTWFMAIAPMKAVK